MSYLDFDFPHTRFFESDLRELIKQVFIMNDLVTNFVSINAIKYADPIQWDITKSYEKNTVVIDGNSGVAYISVRPVPAGVSLTREQYWTKVFDLSVFITKGAANFANTYEQEPTTTATKTTQEGGWVVWDTTLYQALTNIHPGDRYVPDGNIRRMTVEDFFNILKSIIDNEVHEREAGDDALELALNEEADIRGEGDNALHTEIVNESVARENADNTLQDKIDAEVNTRISQDFTLNSRIDEEANERYTADQDIQNYFNSRIGNLNDLETSAKSNVVNSINEVFNLANKRRLKGKKIHIFGDSISDQDWSGSGVNPAGKLPVWVDYFQQSLSGIATITNDSEVGRMMIQLPLILQNYNSIDADIVIVELGTNDFNNNVLLGDYNSNVQCFAAAVGQSFVRIGQLTNYKAEIWFITPFTRNFTYGINNNHETLECFRQSIIGFMKHWGGCWINGDGVPRMSSFFDALYDGIHPRAEFNPSLAAYIESCLETFKCDVEFTNSSYFGDLSSLIDSTKFTNQSSIRYHLNGQSVIVEGMLYPNSNNLGVGDYITTGDLGDLMQIIMPARYQPASVFINDVTQSTCPAFVFVSDNKLCWRIDKDRTNVLQLSFRFEFKPGWCNVFTDGMT